MAEAGFAACDLRLFPMKLKLTGRCFVGDGWQIEKLAVQKMTLNLNFIFNW